MSVLEQMALEREIVEKFQRLPPESQTRVLSRIQPDFGDSTFDDERWFAEAAAFRDDLQRQHGADFVLPLQALLDEVREEASWLR